MDFSTMIPTWIKAVTSPNPSFAEGEQSNPQATWTPALVWMVIAGLVAAVTGFIALQMGAGAMTAMVPMFLDSVPDMTAEARAQVEAALMQQTSLFAFGMGAFGSVVSVPIGFFIGTGISFILARLLGGQGSFSRYAYITAAFAAPLSILSSIIGMIPVVSCLAIGVSIYQIILSYHATMVEMRLSSGKALLVVLLPLIVLILIFSCLAMSVIGIIFAAISAGAN